MNEDILRRAVLSQAVQAIGVGRYNRVPEMEMISEGRANNRDQWGRSYQWCGDFITWLMETNGARNNAIVNRASLGVWTPGQNISKIQRCADQYGLNKTTDPRAGWNWKPGDILVFSRPQGNHVGMLLEAPVGGQPFYKSIDGNSMYAAVAVNPRQEILVQVIDLYRVMAVAGAPVDQQVPTQQWPGMPVPVSNPMPATQQDAWFLAAMQMGGAVATWLVMTQPPVPARPFSALPTHSDGADYAWATRDGGWT